MRIKKKRFVLLSIGIIVIMSIIATTAYGASRRNDVVRNKLAVPTLKGKIRENFVPNEPIEIGGTQTKDITIENTGTTGLFVRVMVFPEIKEPNTTDGLLPANIGEEIIVNLEPEWKDGGDGYYYFAGKVSPGETTPSIFKEVTLANNLSESYLDAELVIQVKSETVTAANHHYRKVWWNLDPARPPSAGILKEIDDLLDPLTINP